MKNVKLSGILVFILLISACEKDQVLPDSGSVEDSSIYELSSSSKSSMKGIQYKATGFVEIEWKGADKGGDKGNKPDALLSYFDFNASQKHDNAEAKGEMTYLVLETDLSPHREIRAEVTGLHIDKVNRKAWILGRVISDSKGCTGNGSGGHDSGCSHDDTDGGCSHDDSDEGGCSHDDTDEGGCSHDDTDEGGCSHDDPDGGSSDDDSHDGGCSHDDSDTDGGCSDGSSDDSDHGGMGGSGGSDSDKGNPLSGKNCRLGQVIAVKLHDGGTPGTNGDGITWKWFDPESPNTPNIEEWNSWKHLCKKTIIAGNLVVHK